MTGRWLERAGEWVDEREGSALGALIVFYLAVVVGQASLKLVWADELITFYIAKRPGITGIWRALRVGTDPNPPLMHVLVQWSTAVLGGNALGMRVPAILCVLLAIVAMWWMLRRWVRPVFALIGCLAFMATRGFDYAYDARSYAPMMGFAMASLALWMWAGDLAGWKRVAALAGMAAALAAGISSNYYCVLAFFPIAVGELVSRRLRVGVWVAMAVASLPLIAYMPLIRHNIAEFGPHAWNRPRVSMIGMSYLELVEGIFWPVLGLAVWAVLKRLRFELPKAEMAALGVLLVYPVLGFLVAICGAGMISPRCVAPVCCGMGLAAGVLAQLVFGGAKRAGMAFVLCLVVWVGVREWVCANVLLEQRQAFFMLRDETESLPGERVLVGDSSFVLPFYFYTDGETQDVVVFPVDFAAIHRFEKDDSGEQNLWAGRGGVFPFPVTTLDSAVKGMSRVVVVGRPDGWLADTMRQHGYDLSVTGDETGWARVGGVFTPMAHPETRILQAVKSNHPVQ